MNDNSYHSLLLRTSAGCVGLILFFQLAQRLPVTNIIHQDVPREEILLRAEQLYSTTDLSDLDLRRKVSPDLNNNLLSYAQTHLGSHVPDAFFPAASWTIFWEGVVEIRKEGKQEVAYGLDYDFSGNLIKLEQQGASLLKPPNLKESEAEGLARAFLVEQQVDTTAMELVSTTVNTQGRVRIHSFAFLKDSPINRDLRESYEINVSGKQITYYLARLTFDTDEPIVPERHKTSRDISYITSVVLWLAVSILLLIRFFAKIRHDELEFTRARWLAFAGCLVTWAAMANIIWPSWTEIIFGGGASAILAGIAILIAHPVSESMVRDVWPERMALTDVLFRGFIRVRELGFAILNAVFVSGSILLGFAIIYWVTDFLGGYLEFDDDVLQIFTGMRGLLGTLLDSAVSAGLAGIVLVVFFTSYLCEKLKNRALMVLLFAVFLDAVILQLFNTQPTYLAFLLFLPLALLASYFIFCYDYVTIIISMFTIVAYIDLILLGQQAEPWLSPSGVFACGFAALLVGSGVLLSRSERSVLDFEHYIPGYVGRIAERERFLKELEIARSVQSRFLPQTIPSLPKLDIACVCRPAMEVGGDYYDFVLNGNNSLGVIVGDVSGKGVSAAFYMTMAKGIIKTLCRGSSNPKRILSEMNAIFYENVPKEVFISMIFAEFDLEKSVLRFARAGHNPLIVNRKATGKPEMILPPGLAIGLDSGDIFSRTIEQVEIPIECGDTFVFYTDGISESTSKNGDEFGEDRLCQCIARANGQSAAHLLERISTDVARFSKNTKQHDDFTMVVIKVGDPLNPAGAV